MGVPEQRRPREPLFRRSPRAESRRLTVAGERRATRRARLPHVSLIIAFAVMVLIGTILLSLPWATTDQTSTDVLTAFFTATSATFVTGLTLFDTGTYWSWFGEAVILALIQLGGLGFITGIVLIIIGARRGDSLEDRQAMRITFGGGSLGHVQDEAKQIIRIAVAVQIVGFLILVPAFGLAGLGWVDAVWNAVFHSVSAFHNAGFDVTGGEPSLYEYRNSPWIVGTITMMSLIGALGTAAFVMMIRMRRWRPLSLNVKLVLAGTAGIIVAGFVGFSAGEWTNPATLGPQNVLNKILDGFVLAVGSRTSGFSTFDVSAVETHTLFLLILLMVIGGAAGSMTGGIKINVFMALYYTVWSSIKGLARTDVFGREIPAAQIRRALAIAAFAFVWVNTMALLLSLVEGLPFEKILFDQVSAFALVGLSTGVIPEMSGFGKGVIILSMFVGRFAPFFIALELSQRDRRMPYRYPSEEIRIG